MSRRPGRAAAGRLLVLAAVVWVVIGVVAVVQRGYLKGSSHTCAKAGAIALTVIAGPLNYLGVNPTPTCHLPQPSK